jgi:hypothetical protein
MEPYVREINQPVVACQENCRTTARLKLTHYYAQARIFEEDKRGDLLRFQETAKIGSFEISYK